MVALLRNLMFHSDWMRPWHGLVAVALAVRRRADQRMMVPLVAKTSLAREVLCYDLNLKFSGSSKRQEFELHAKLRQE